MAYHNDQVIDPFSYLEEDHKKVSEVFAQIENTTERAEKKRTELFTILFETLSLHAELEEQIVYPVLERIKKTEDIIQEAEQEHHIIKILLTELGDLSPTDEVWTAKMKVLQETVEHHVKEEQNNAFPKARKELSAEKQASLAANMETFLAS